MKGAIAKALRVVPGFRDFAGEMLILQRHLLSLTKVTRLIAASPDLKIELGGGKIRKPGFINVDAFSAAADLKADLRRDLPFPTNSVTEIRSEHVFEHFSYPDSLGKLLKECHRILKPGAKMILSVPDAGKAFRLYNASPEDFEESLKSGPSGSFWTTPKPNWCKSPIDYINWLIYMDGQHRFMFDERNLIRVLEDAGFIAQLREFDPAIDRPERRVYSLYAVATKPA
jgi:SAM-dependent methyltransferase